nr:hypothetical protein [Tanacetum cinerariifolium]
ASNLIVFAYEFHQVTAPSIKILLQGGSTSDGSNDSNASGGGKGDLDLLRDDDGKGGSGGEDGDVVDGDDNLALLRGGVAISSPIAA